jgi:carboxylesterase type B
VNGIPWTYGAVHFQEVAFAFYNTMGLGYPQNLNPNPLGGPNKEEYDNLARLMSRMWVSFVNFGDPNKQLGGAYGEHLSSKFASLTRCSRGRDMAGIQSR